MAKEITKRYGKYLFCFSPILRDMFIDNELERRMKGLDEQSYVLQRLEKQKVNVLWDLLKNTNSSDDGIDFVVSTCDCVWITQLKWWSRPITTKQAKTFFGEMYLSDYAICSRSKGIKVKYMLLAPLLTSSVIQKGQTYLENDYHMVAGDEFVRFINNPISIYNSLKLEDF